MSKPISGARAMRLECIKIAASVVCQLKDPKISVVSLAGSFMAFIDGPQDAEDDVVDGYDAPPPYPAPAQNGSYTLRDLRRGRS